MNKTISRKIMKRTRMRHKFLRDRTEANRRGLQYSEKLLCSIDTKNRKRLLQ